MRATVMHGAGDVRIENVPDARLIEPNDALIRVTRAAICGSDLWPYKSMEPSEPGRRMGHEFIGLVEAVGPEVRTIKRGDLVVSPFLWSDGACVFCREGLPSSCLHGGRYGWGDVDGGQGEAVRVPEADGTLVALPVEPDDALMPSLLTLADVMATGHHAAVSARVGPGATAAIIGDGAVGLCGVIAARRLGAERIILLGSHPARVALGKEFGATDIVSERGEAAVERVRELTGGLGAHAVLECVGHELSMRTAIDITRPGGAVGRVGVPQTESIPEAVPTLFNNITISGGVAPARAYIGELLSDVLDGQIEPGRVFDRVVALDGVPGGYRAMNERESIKVLIEFPGAASREGEQCMTTWTSSDLARIGGAEELQLASVRPDGTLRPYVTMWVVRSGDDLYVRSAYGPDNPWYRRAKESALGRIRAGGLERDVTFAGAESDADAGIDAAYHAKYDRYGPKIVGTVVGPAAAAVTLKLVPRNGAR